MGSLRVGDNVITVLSHKETDGTESNFKVVGSVWDQ